MNDREIKIIQNYANGQRQYLKRIAEFIILPEDNSVYAQFTREILKDEPDNDIYFNLKKQILVLSKPVKRLRPSFRPRAKKDK